MEPISVGLSVPNVFPHGGQYTCMHSMKAQYKGRDVAIKILDNK